MAWLVRLLADACAVALATALFAGIRITGDTFQQRLSTLVVVAVLFGLVNALVRPVVATLSFPLYLLTLGLMFFVVNALMLMLTNWLARQLDVGFNVSGFGAALGGAVVISLVSWSMTKLFDTD
ncbi:MAG: phage holin family protein [Nocardioidaceae bacterium]